MARRVLRPKASRLYQEALRVDSTIERGTRVLWLLLTSSQVNPAVIFVRRLVAAFSVIAIAVLSFQPFLAKAELSTFYPSSCLGGWQNPEAAQGEPESLASGTLEASTSALLPNTTIADLYCGSFRGKIPEDTVPKSAKLTIVWGYSEQPSETKPIVSSNIASSTDAILNGTASSSIQFVPEEASTTASTTENVHNEQSLSGMLKTAFLASFQKAYAEEDAAISSDTPAALPETTTVPPSSDPQATNTSPQEKAAPDVIQDASTTSQQSAAPADASSTQDTASSSSSTPAVAEDVSSSVSVPDALFEVFYTLDGTNWQSLGIVRQSELANATFDIPLRTDDGDAWNTIANLQINVKRLPTLNDVRPVLLDGMVLTIEHEASFKKEEVKSDSKRLAVTNVVSGDTTSVSLKEDSDQGQIIKVKGKSEETLVIYSGDTKQAVLTLPLSEDEAEIQAYQFQSVGHYVGVVTKRNDACYLLDLVACGRDKGAVDSISFDVTPTINTPLEYRPAETVPVK